MGEGSVGESVLQTKLSRRNFLKGMTATAVTLAVGSSPDTVNAPKKQPLAPPVINFVPIEEIDDTPSVIDLEAEKQSIENIKTVFSMVINPSFATSCDPNFFTGLDTDTNNNQIRSLLEKRKRVVERNPQTGEIMRKNEQFMMRVQVHNAPLAQLASLVTADDSLNEKLRLSELFQMDFALTISADGDGKIQTFLVDTTTESEMRLQQLQEQDTEVMQKAYTSVDGKTVYDLYPSRREEKEAAMHIIFKNVPSPDDSRWGVESHGATPAFYDGRAVSIQQERWNLNYSYTVGTVGSVYGTR